MEVSPERRLDTYPKMAFLVQWSQASIKIFISEITVSCTVPRYRTHRIMVKTIRNFILQSVTKSERECLSCYLLRQKNTRIRNILVL